MVRVHYLEGTPVIGVGGVGWGYYGGGLGMKGNRTIHCLV